MKKIFFYTTILFVTLNSCDREEMSSKEIDQIEKVSLTPEEIISISFNDPKELSESEVLDLVDDFPLTLNPEVKRKFENATASISRKLYYDENGGFSSTKKIAAKHSKGLTLPIYDVDVVKGNIKMKAYVSADERYPSVLAYVPYNERSDFDIFEHPMYAYSLDLATRRIFTIN